MKNQFFSKSQKKLCQSNCFNKAHFMNLFRMVFMFKAKLLPSLRKVEKTLFSNKKTINFVAVFEKTRIFEKKQYSQTYTIGLTKQSSSLHFSSKYPNLLTKIELLSHFYQKTWFFPVFPHFSHYKSTHNKILGKRSKSVSLELHFRPACQFLSNSIPTILRSALFPSK